jgi:hypothetical protein
MERSTVKTILLIIGSAIGGILLFIATIYGYLIHTFYSGGRPPEMSFPSQPIESRETVSVPPEIKERFFGSQGSYSGSFPHDRNRVLATGPGRIVGRVTSGGKPVAGLRLSLALNGSVMSESAETDAAGRYAISVPYGRYRIDGYQLDYKVVDAVLGGKTDSPQNHPDRSDDIMTVAEGKPGRGLDLQYVDPVRLKGPSGQVSQSQPIVLEWEAYPGAAEYEIQLTEARDPSDYASRRQLFKCCSLPRASGTSFNLRERGVALKKDHVYFVSVTALDTHGKRLAESAGRQIRPTFSVSD